MKKKMLMVLLGMLVSAMAFGGIFDSLFGKNKNEKKQKEVVVWAWNVAAKGLEATVADFNKKNPNIKIIVKDIGRTDVYDKLTVGLESGTGLPDVVQIENEPIANYLDKFPKGFLDITDKAMKYKKDMDPSKMSILEKNGKIYGLPWDSAPAGIFYRRDYFEKAGVNPEAIKTWDDYIEAGKKVLSATGKKMLPINYTGDDALFRMIMNQEGVFYFNKKGEVQVNSPKAVKALAIIDKMVKAGITLNAPDWNTFVTSTKNGRVATVPFGVWWGGTLKDQMSELSGKFGVIPCPAVEKGGNRATNLGGSNLLILSSTKVPEAAWKFVEHALATKEGQMTMYKKFALFPAYIPAYKDPYFEEGDKFFAGQKVSKLFGEMVPNIPEVYYGPNHEEARQFVINAKAAVVTGEETPQEALNTAAKRISNAVNVPIQ